MNMTVFVIINAAWFGCMLILAWGITGLRTQLDQAKTSLAIEREARKDADAYARATKDYSTALVEAVVPLIEKTSWQTYWKAGNAKRAIAEEASRNQAVDTARRALWTIPVFAEYITTTKENDQ